MFLYFTYSTKDLRFIWEIYLKRKSPPNPQQTSPQSRRERQQFYHQISVKSECGAHHREFAKRGKDRRKISPFYVARQLELLLWMFSRWALTRPQQDLAAACTIHIHSHPELTCELQGPSVVANQLRPEERRTAPVFVTRGRFAGWGQEPTEAQPLTSHRAWEMGSLSLPGFVSKR